MRRLLASIAVTGAVLALPRPVHALRTDHATGRMSVAAFTARMRRTPSFARQMKLSCAVCHLGGFPQLTRFGRLFKLNGYTLSGLPQIVEQLDSASQRTLELSSIPGLSMTALISSTTLQTPLPGTATTRNEYPQALSFFFGGEISPRMGALAEVSYSDVSGRLAIDNTDVRFASHTILSRHDLLYGVTLHNNPTVQDVWNTAPAWRYPFASSPLSPLPAASTVLDGALAQSVLGLGAYALYDNVLYAEVTGYAAAPQGPRALIDSGATSGVRGVAPYWRLALQNRNGPVYVMLGTFGLSAARGIADGSRPDDRFTDIGADLQVERESGEHLFVGRASYTHEKQTLGGARAATPPQAANATNSLRSMRVSAQYGFNRTWSASAAYFTVSGTADAVRYAPAAVTGSRAGDPRTAGEILEVTMNPWLNTRLGVQYLMYDRFNGAATAYDVTPAGRAASGNNTLYAYLWLAF